VDLRARIGRECRKSAVLVCIRVTQSDRRTLYRVCLIIIRNMALDLKFRTQIRSTTPKDIANFNLRTADVFGVLNASLPISCAKNSVMQNDASPYIAATKSSEPCTSTTQFGEIDHISGALQEMLKADWVSEIMTTNMKAFFLDTICIMSRYPFYSKFLYLRLTNRMFSTLLLGHDRPKYCNSPLSELWAFCAK